MIGRSCGQSTPNDHRSIIDTSQMSRSPSVNEDPECELFVAGVDSAFDLRATDLGTDLLAE